MFYCDHENAYRVFNDEGKEFTLEIEIYMEKLYLTMGKYKIIIFPNGETKYYTGEEKSQPTKAHKFMLNLYYTILPDFAESVREIELEEEEKILEYERQEEYDQYRLAVYGY